MGPLALFVVVLAQVSAAIPHRHPTPSPLPPHVVINDDFRLLPPPVIEPELPQALAEPARAAPRLDMPVPSHMAFYIRFWVGLGILVMVFGIVAPIVRRRQRESMSPGSRTGRLHKIDLIDVPPTPSPGEWLRHLFGPHIDSAIPVVSPATIQALVAPAVSDDVVLVAPAPSNDATAADDAETRKVRREKEQFEVYIQGVRSLARRMIGPHTLRCMEVPKGPPELRWRTWLDAPTWEQAQIRANGLRQGAAWRKLIRAYEREGGRWIDHAVETHGGPQTMDVSTGIDHSLEASKPRSINPPAATKDIAATKDLLRSVSGG